MLNQRLCFANIPVISSLQHYVKPFLSLLHDYMYNYNHLQMLMILINP